MENPNTYTPTQNEFYVYVYWRLDENKRPFYVGKGKGERAWAPHPQNPHFNRIVAKHPYKISCAWHGESEEEAFRIERLLIAVFGRRNNQTGTLTNLTDGGQGTSGIVFSEERNRKISAALKVVCNTPEQRRKNSERVKKLFEDPELRKRHSAAMEKAYSDPERKKMAAANLNKTNNTLEGREKISNRMKQKWEDPEARVRQSAALKAAWQRKKEQKTVEN